MSSEILFRPIGATPTVTAGTVTGDPVAVEADQLLVVLEVTAAATDVTDTLDVFLDGRTPNGTWINLIHFPQVVGNGGAKKFAVSIGANAAATIVDVSADAAVNTVRALSLPLYVRYRAVMVDANANGSFTWGLAASGHRPQ